MPKLLASAFVVLTLAGCGGSDPASDPATFDNARTTGNPAVFSRIESSTSCTALQREFDTAMDNAEARESGDPVRDISLSYARAADNRMKEVGCYG